MPSIAGKPAIITETLRRWVRKAEQDTGERAGLTTNERQRLKGLECENRELKRANEILRKASAFDAQSELDRGRVRVAFIDHHREACGVEPVCRMLPIAPLTYFCPKARKPIRLRARRGRVETTNCGSSFLRSG